MPSKKTTMALIIAFAIKVEPHARPFLSGCSQLTLPSDFWSIQQWDRTLSDFPKKNAPPPFLKKKTWPFQVQSLNAMIYYAVFLENNLKKRHTSSCEWDVHVSSSLCQEASYFLHSCAIFVVRCLENVHMFSEFWGDWNQSHGRKQKMSNMNKHQGLRSNKFKSLNCQDDFGVLVW